LGGLTDVRRRGIRHRSRTEKFEQSIDILHFGRRAMPVNWVDLIAIAFGAFNLLRLASYFPQIAAVARDQYGATAISLSCWSIWIGANGTTALYAWVNLGDLTLAMISAFNAACCLAVFALAVYKRATVRLQWARSHPFDPPGLNPAEGPSEPMSEASVVTALRPSRGQRSAGS
jgi:hypothetical protein